MRPTILIAAAVVLALAPPALAADNAPGVSPASGAQRRLRCASPETNT